MSNAGASAERATPWRRPSAQGNQQQQQQPQASSSLNRTASGSNTPRDRSNTPSRGAGGVQGQNNVQKGAAGGSVRRDNGTALAGQAGRPSQASQPPKLPGASGDAHVPINGFNADEVREDMRRAYEKAVADAGGDENALLCKPNNTTEQQKKNAPWGPKPANQMANGQNFFVELARQVRALEEAEQKSRAQQESPRK